MILDTIAAATKKRVARCKEERPAGALREQALAVSGRQPFMFERALAGEKDISFICEVKRASPSKGVIAKEFPYLQIAEEYKAAGAAAISVLTEPEFFLGDPSYLSGIRQVVETPLLRKDFVIDPYQIYEAKLLGADAVLLICALLDTETLRAFLQICDALGLSALVEAHDSAEVRSALAAGARVVGVNNRDLRTFAVDLNTCLQLRGQVPEDRLFVAESGIKTRQDIRALRSAGVDAALIGETLMRSPDKKRMLSELRGMRHA